MGSSTLVRSRNRSSSRTSYGSISNNVRDQYGRFMTPTSNNSADANIPLDGRPSRIRARNLMEGDTLLLPGVGRRKVLSLQFFKGKISKGEYVDPSVMVIFVNNDKTGLRAWNIQDVDQMVTILERPRTRKARRDMSRTGERIFWNLMRI